MAFDWFIESLPRSGFSVLVIASTTAVLYVGLLAIYRLTLHPLARFPGPRLAAISRAYANYYEILGPGGQYSEKIEGLHRQYNSPIIRVTPDEVHILDRNFYDQLYNFNSELDKKDVGNQNLQYSPTYEVHRLRRKAWDPYFSRAGIQRLEPLIRDMVKKLVARIRETQAEGSVVKIGLLYRFLTCDVICEYLFSQPHDLLDPGEDAKGEKFIAAFLNAFKFLYVSMEIGMLNVLFNTLSKLPSWMLPSDENREFVQTWQIGLRQRLEIIRKGDLQGIKRHPLPTVFEQYIHNPNIPSEDKALDQLQNNALMFVGAGFETTGFALSTATYHLLSNPAMVARLKTELASIWPGDGDLPTWATLEKLPYLTAVIKESMRLSVGVMSRLSRVNRRRPMQYKQWTIPAGMYVSMSTRFILYDPEIFPQPHEFRPDRWLQGERGKELDKWLVVFSRGARVCIGQNLAWAELYLVLSAVVHNFGLELVDTSRADVDPKYDHFVPFTATEDWVRVSVK